jgi:hypothetical protein
MLIWSTYIAKYGSRWLKKLGTVAALILFCTGLFAQDTLVMPVTGNGGVYNTCDALIFDNGINANYPDFSHATLTIAPLWTQSVHLYFEEFDTEIHFDSLNIFDGPATAFPLIGTYSGTSLQGQTIVSTGNAITLEFRSDDIQTASGFKIRVTCLMGEENWETANLELFPNPAQTYLDITGVDDSQIKTLYIIDAQGRFFPATMNQGRVEVGDFTPGLYGICLDLINGCRVFKKWIKI